jgi:SAM-dependent methyltransferase
MAQLDHPLRRMIDPSGSNYFIELKCNELLWAIEQTKLNKDELTVVDVGCGIGQFEDYLGGHFKKLLGFDLSLEMLRVATRLYPLQTGGGYICANALSLPLPDETADVVFSSCLMHHLPAGDLLPALCEMQRVAKRGGYVVIFEHNPLNPLTQLVVRTTPLDRMAKLQFHWRVRSMLAEVGLRLRLSQFILYGPGWLDNFLKRFRDVLYQLPFGGQYYLIAQKV